MSRGMAGDPAQPSPHMNKFLRLHSICVATVGALAAFCMARYAFTSTTATPNQRHFAEAIALMGCISTWKNYQKLQQAP